MYPPTDYPDRRRGPTTTLKKCRRHIHPRDLRPRVRGAAWRVAGELPELLERFGHGFGDESAKRNEGNEREKQR